MSAGVGSPRDMREILVSFKKRYIETSQERIVVYAEPGEYIPKEIRKKYGLGEYYEDTDK